ncbi:MAG: molybdate ABC transporter substrate-binding protein [Hyphomicrobiaceae bacterium]|nr:molybdate ABC transporter substrate-binding protein [Hyphomicrobiaceae bacterium]
MRRSWAASLFLIAALGASAHAADGSRATIFAAASLVDVLGELAGDFKAMSGAEVVLVTGSSSTLAAQILAGAPADAFISANKDYADQVALTVGAEPQDLFGNALVLIAPRDFEGTVDIGDIADALGDGRLALGDPAHVPAGIYAREALEYLGEWPTLQDHLAPAGDVRGALNFVATGAAPFGIVYATDAVDPSVRIVATFPQESHAPIRYWGVEVTPDSATSDQFFAFLESPEAVEVLTRFGFQTGTSPDGN